MQNSYICVISLMYFPDKYSGCCASTTMHIAAFCHIYFVRLFYFAWDFFRYVVLVVLILMHIIYY